MQQLPEASGDDREATNAAHFVMNSAEFDVHKPGKANLICQTY